MCNYKLASFCIIILSGSNEGFGFNSRLGQTEDIIIGICCFSTKHLRVRGKIGRPRVRIMCLGDLTCIPAEAILIIFLANYTLTHGLDGIWGSCCLLACPSIHLPKTKIFVLIASLALT